MWWRLPVSSTTSRCCSTRFPSPRPMPPIAPVPRLSTRATWTSASNSSSPPYTAVTTLKSLTSKGSSEGSSTSSVHCGMKPKNVKKNYNNRSARYSNMRGNIISWETSVPRKRATPRPPLPTTAKPLTCTPTIWTPMSGWESPIWAKACTTRPLRT